MFSDVHERKQKKHSFALIDFGKFRIRLKDLKFHFFILSFIFFTVRAQDMSLLFNRVERLSSLGDEVYEVKQAPNGLLWIGSENGLFSYDGKNISAFSCEGLRNSSFSLIKFGSKGEVFARNFAGQIVKIEDDTMRIILTKPPNIGSLVNYSIDLDNRLWLFENHLLKAYTFDGTLQKKIQVPYSSLFYEKGSHTFRNGTLCLGLKNGLLLSLEGSGNVLKDTLREYGNPVKVKAFFFYEIRGKKKAIVQYYSKDGLPVLHLDLEKGRIDQQTELHPGLDEIKSIAMVKGRLLIQSKTAIHEFKHGKLVPLFLGRGLNHLCVDSERALWLSNDGKGISYCSNIEALEIRALSNKTEVEFLLHKNTLNVLTSNQWFELNSVKTGESLDIIPTQIKALNTLKPVFSRKQIISDKIVYYKGYFITKSGGVFKDTNYFRNFDSNGDTVYAASNIGVFKYLFTRDGMKLLKKLSNEESYFVAKTKDGLFASFVSGTKFYESNKWKGLAFKGRPVYATQIFKKGRYIYFCESSDVFVRNNNQWVGSFKLSKGEKVRDITVFKGFQYILTNHWIYVYDKGIKRVGSISLLNDLGFSNLETMEHFNGGFVLHGSGRTGYVKGLSIPRKFNKPQILKAKIMVNGKIYDNSGKASVFSQSTIAIALQAVSYRDKRQGFYHFTIVKDLKDTFHNKTQEDQMVFNSLQPGKYSIQVWYKAVNGVKSPSRFVRFELLPPFWLRWWFVLAVVFVFLLIVYFATRGVINRAKRKNMLEVAVVKARLGSLRSRMNPHFIFNTLNGMYDLFLNKREEEANEYITNLSELIRFTLDYSEEDTVFLKKEVQMLNKYLSLEKLRFKDKIEYSIIFDNHVEQNMSVLKIPPLMLQPVVENSLKHGLANKKDTNGKLYVHFSMKKKDLYVSITDNGVGLSPSSKSQKHVSQSSKITNTRINLLNLSQKEEIKWGIENASKNKNETGTKVWFIFPQ